MGLSFGDDTWYLSGGATIKASDFLYFQYWEPLYSLWFKFLTFFCADPVSRYFLSWGIIVVFIAMIPTLMKIPAASIYTFLVVAFPFLTVGPFVALFAAGMVLFGLCLILRRERRPSEIMATACVVCFIAGFARAEFDYGVFLGAIATLAALVVEARSASASTHPRLPRRPNGAAIAGMVLGLALTMLFIMGHSRMQRSGGAFAQHFNKRAAERGIIPSGPTTWKSDYAEKAFGVDPGHNAGVGTASLGDFIRANPRLFLGHVLRNAMDPRTFVFVIVFLAILAVPWFREEDRPLRSASIFVFILGLPPLMGMFAIYPRDHYPIILVPSLILFALQWIRPQWATRSGLPWVLAAGFVLIWFFNIKLVHLRYGAMSPELANLRSVQCLRSVDRVADPSNLNVFDAGSINAVYFVHHRTARGRADLPKWQEFQEWAAQSHPAWISIEPYSAYLYGVTPVQLDGYLKETLGYAPQPCDSASNFVIYTPVQPPKPTN